MWEMESAAMSLILSTLTSKDSVVSCVKGEMSVLRCFEAEHGPQNIGDVSPLRQLKQQHSSFIIHVTCTMLDTELV